MLSILTRLKMRALWMTGLGVGLIFSTVLAGSVRAQDFSRWEPAIAAFERQDRQSPPPQGAVLFVGSSSIRGWDLKKYFPDREVINRGFGGSQLADSVHFADRIILKHRPRTVVLYAGDNDIAAGKSPQQVHADFQEFIETIHAELPETRILFIAIKPSLMRWELVDKIRRANGLVKATCQETDGVAYVDIFTPMLGKDGRPNPNLLAIDGLHLSMQGYALWTSLVKQHLSMTSGMSSSKESQ